MKRNDATSKSKIIKPKLYTWYWVYCDGALSSCHRRINKGILVKWCGHVGEHFGDGCYNRKCWSVFEIDCGFERDVEGIDFRIAREATWDELRATAQKAIANAAEIAEERIPSVLGVVEV